jgi:hypothetical protein
VKKYLVLGALCLFASLHMLLFGCTMGLVSTQKETQSEQEIGTLQGKDKNWVKFRSEDGITTYIIRDRNGKMVGMKMVKEPWVNIPVPRCYPDTKAILVNQDRQEEVEKTKIGRTQRLTCLFPICETPIFPEVNKENREPVLSKYSHGKSMVEGSPHEPGDDSDIGVKADGKTYSLDMAFPAKWLPGFVLRSMELKNGGDIKFKIPVPSSDWDVKFGLKFKSKRLELSNNSERIIIGLFTIAFGGKEHKKAANLAATDGSFF